MVLSGFYHLVILDLSGCYSYKPQHFLRPSDLCVRVRVCVVCAKHISRAVMAVQQSYFLRQWGSRGCGLLNVDRDYVTISLDNACGGGVSWVVGWLGK